MAKIYQRSLFSWKDVDELGDLERLQLIIDTMPDEKLILKLKNDRRNGREITLSGQSGILFLRVLCTSTPP